MIGFLAKAVTGNPILLVYGAIGIGVAAGAAGAAGAWTVQGYRLEALQGRFDVFKTDVQSKGEQAKADAKRIEAENELKKGKADAENAATKRNLAIALDSLRKSTPDPRSRGLPAAPAASDRPDLICLDRAEYQRADGEATARLFDGARRLADEGTAATVDLDTARHWAQEK